MESVDYLRFIMALLLVLGLAWLLMVAARTVLARQVGSKTGGRRLRVIESLQLDAKHRLVMIERDGTGHLLLLGQQGSCVVEQGIALPEEELGNDDISKSE